VQSVASVAAREGATKVRWLTAPGNATARRLYDRLAENRGFIRYQMPI
jgi:hypothetical protein